MKATRAQLTRIRSMQLQLGEAYSADAQACHRIINAIASSAFDGCPLDILVKHTGQMMSTFKTGSDEWAKIGCLQNILVSRMSNVAVAAAILN